VPSDLTRILAEKVRRSRLVDIRRCRIRSVERLAQPDETIVSVQLQPQHVWIGWSLQRLEPSNPQASFLTLDSTVGA
jgi:hypothetical protein